MKKILKSVLSFFIIATIVVSALAFNVSAASASISCGSEYEIGKSFTVKISFNADATLYAVEADVSYNSSVLRLDNVSGADFNPGNGSVKIVDDKFSATKPAKTSSYTLSFTAIAAGNSNISASFLGAGEAESRASSSVAVTVVAPKPSSNANLASIKLSNGSLSPAFNPNTTKYNVTVKYSVESINITGAVADGKSTYTGGGTINLQLGNNERVLTVTAEDGSKKSYTINIKRMTEQETLEAEQAARDANPLLVIIDNTDYFIVNNFEGISIPTGFSQGTITRKDSEIAVLNEASGKYQLCWLADTNGENGAFYHRDENDNYIKLSYVNANGITYIIEALDDDIALPTGFVRRQYTKDNQNSDAIKYIDEALEDFYIFNCFVPTQQANAFYRYDSVEGTMQRAVDYDAAVEAEKQQALDEQQQAQQTSWFGAMSKTGRIVFFTFIAVAVLFITVAILLIVKISSSGKDEEDDEYTSLENDEFVIPVDETDDSDDNAQADTSDQSFDTQGEETDNTDE